MSLSEDGNTALIGGYHNDTSRRRGVGVRALRARMGTNSRNSWARAQSAVSRPRASSVALSGDGDTALVGGAGDNGEEGAAWVFTRTPRSKRQNQNRQPKHEPKKLPTTGAVAGRQRAAPRKLCAGDADLHCRGIASTACGGRRTAARMQQTLARPQRRVHPRQPRGARRAAPPRAWTARRSRSSSTTASRWRRRRSARTASSPPPRRCRPARLRDSNDARYKAESGSQRSLQPQAHAAPQPRTAEGLRQTRSRSWARSCRR